LNSLERYFDKYNIKKIEENIRGICEEYECRMEEEYTGLKKELGKPLMDSLKQRGISGSAVEINIKTSSKWSDILDQLDSKYNRLLCSVKREIDK
jgi:hypothetical protein